MRSRGAIQNSVTEVLEFIKSLLEAKEYAILGEFVEGSVYNYNWAQTYSNIAVAKAKLHDNALVAKRDKASACKAENPSSNLGEGSSEDNRKCLTCQSFIVRNKYREADNEDGFCFAGNCLKRMSDEACDTYQTKVLLKRLLKDAQKS